jgi:hypothetical protein
MLEVYIQKESNPGRRYILEYTIEMSDYHYHYVRNKQKKSVVIIEERLKYRHDFNSPSSTHFNDKASKIFKQILEGPKKNLPLFLGVRPGFDALIHKRLSGNTVIKKIYEEMKLYV